MIATDNGHRRLGRRYAHRIMSSRRSLRRALLLGRRGRRGSIVHHDRRLKHGTIRMAGSPSGLRSGSGDIDDPGLCDHRRRSQLRACRARPDRSTFCVGPASTATPVSRRCWVTSVTALGVISPAGYVSADHRRYRDDTAILETEHVTDTGRVRVTDLMPWRDGPSSIIRIVEGLEGEVQMAMSLRLRFGYGQIAPWRRAPRTRAHFRGRPGSRRPRLSRRTGDGQRRAPALASWSPRARRIAFVLAYSPSISAVAPAVED